MRKTFTLINLDTLTKEVNDAIAGNDYRQKLTDTVVGFLRTSWPKRPDRRINDKLQATLEAQGLRTTRAELVRESRGDFTLKIHTPKEINGGTVSYYLYMKEDGQPDIDYAMKQHDVYATHAAQLREKLKQLPAKVEEFNSHLRALSRLTEFARDEDRNYYSLYPLSDAFCWYEFKNIK